MQKVSSLPRADAAALPDAAVPDPRGSHDLGKTVLGANAARAMVQAELQAGDAGAARAFVRDELSACGKALAWPGPAPAQGDSISGG